MLRYDVSHPVVNDSGMAVWAALGVSSWPTLAVVSPRGRLIAMLSGEGHRQVGRGRGWGGVGWDGAGGLQL